MPLVYAKTSILDSDVVRRLVRLVGGGVQYTSVKPQLNKYQPCGGRRFHKCRMICVCRSFKTHRFIKDLYALKIDRRWGSWAWARCRHYFIIAQRYAKKYRFFFKMHALRDIVNMQERAFEAKE